jgi:galactokinase/mevalonate kinase-like predicted kinase
MDISNIVTYGLGSIAVFGALSIITQKLAGGGKVKNLLKSFKRDERQKQLEKNIKTLTAEQEVISKQLSAAEVASEETKEKIQAIFRKSAVEAQKILKADTIQEIDEQIEEDWEKL